MRQKLFMFTISTMLFAGSAVAAPVVFEDAGLELLVRAAINQAEGDIDDQDPRLAEVLSITSGALLIDSLVGIEILVNLEVLSLPNNQVADLAPLAGLVALTELNLADNNVSDIAILSGLDQLEILNLNNNNLANISALQSLRDLVELRLADNAIAQIGALASLGGPAILELQNNVIRDAGPLLNVGQFPAGATVDLRGNPLSTDSLCTVVLPLQQQGVDALADGECPGIIVGQVRDATTLLPITCAIVIAEPPVGSTSIGPSGLDGSYQLDGLPPGVITLRIFAPGYQPEVGQGSVMSSSQRRISFDLERQLTGAFRVIRGDITDIVSGAQLAGVQVEATSGQRRLGETFTCADGEYQLLLEQSTTEATITYNALGYAEAVFTLSEGQPEDVALTPLTTNNASIAGRVFDGRSRTPAGLANARVTLRAEGGAVAYSTRTGDRGEYLATNLPADIYTVRVSSAAIDAEFAQRTIELEGGTEDFDFVLGSFVDEGDGDRMGCPDTAAMLPPAFPGATWLPLVAVMSALSLLGRRRRATGVAW